LYIYLILWSVVSLIQHRLLAVECMVFGDNSATEFHGFHKLHREIWQNLPQNRGPADQGVIIQQRHCWDTMPALRQLQWLPVRQRSDFNLAVLVYKSVHGFTLPCLSDDCQLVRKVGRRHLWSADIYTGAVPWTQSQIGDRSFTVAGPRLWNNMPVELWQWDISFGQFKRLHVLKTYGLLQRDCDAL